jgi:branched-chain amino acid transport system substrate-binding protein
VDLPLRAPLSRRDLLRGAGAIATIAGGAGLAGCSILRPKSRLSLGAGDARPIRLGYVTPSTGPLSAFGEADLFVANSLRAYFSENGIKTGAGTSAVEIVVRDSKSDVNIASTVAAELIDSDHVDMMLVASTPETTNPVADQCEQKGVPCISTVAPWQPYFFGRGASPVSTFKWTYHFFWGQEDVEAIFMDMWDAVGSNGKVGALWPDDSDGNAFGDPATGFLPVATRRGYEMVDPGSYSNGTQDFSSQIAMFKDAKADIVVGTPIPADFETFWRQAVEQEYRPRMVTMTKSLSFPEEMAALGDIGNNLCCCLWWSPDYPYTSSLTGQSARDLADEYAAQTGRQWTQPIGYVHALFEVASAALGQAASPDDRNGTIEALSQLQVQTVCGRLDWNAGPVPNVAKTPLVGGQWRIDGDKAEVVVASNAQALDIPRVQTVQPLVWPEAAAAPSAEPSV